MKTQVEREIKAMELVRDIRDRHYEELKGRSKEEVLKFFRNAAGRVHAGMAHEEPKTGTGAS